MAHGYRVSAYAWYLGSLLSKKGKYASILSASSLDELCRSALYHDIGKCEMIALSNKDGPLDLKEQARMRQHTVRGYHLASSRGKMAADIALYHHEHYDGRGYPFGLEKGDIPLPSRIVMVSDRFDALASKRSYKKGLADADIYRIFTEGDGRLFPEDHDPLVLDAFVSHYDEFSRMRSYFDGVSTCRQV